MKRMLGHLGLFIWTLFVGFLISVYGLPMFFIMVLEQLLDAGGGLEKATSAAVAPGTYILPIPYEVKKTLIENGTLTFVLYLFIGIIGWPILKSIRKKLKTAVQTE